MNIKGLLFLIGSIGSKITANIIGIYQGITIGLLLSKLPLIFIKEDKRNLYLNNLAEKMIGINNYIKSSFIHCINFIQFATKNAYLYAKENKYVVWGYVIATTLILYFVASYESQILNYIFENKKFFTDIAQLFVHNIYSQIFTVLFIIAALYDICIKISKKHRLDGIHLFVLFWIVWFLIKYRLQQEFSYVYFWGDIAYIDIIYSVGILYGLTDFYNLLQRQKIKYHTINTSIIKKPILEDSPLGDGDEDIFDYDDDAKKIVEQINIIPTNKTFSFAIIGQWGAGKSSFLYLIEKELNKEKFEIIKFNPRNCQSSTKIQEEFFSLLACTLAKYDSSCSNTIKDYMSALQIIDNRNSFEKLIKLYKIWDKEGIKDKINNTLKKMCTKVIIIIDDFDRLTENEILEVLKLIDSNAAFNNIVFITAFDKAQVSKMLGEKYKSNHADFVDKFFNIEQTVPQRPYKYLSNYLSSNILRLLELSPKDADTIKKYIDGNNDTIKTHLTTLRDIKRFVNQIYLDYKLVSGDVNIIDFFCLHLLKYKYLEVYTNLDKKKYLNNLDKNTFETDQLWIVDNIEDFKIDKEALSILRTLFPKKEERDRLYYKRIYEAQSFENYFINKIYGTLRIKEMANCLTIDRDKAFNQVRTWANGASLLDISAYLRNTDPLQLNSKTEFIRYAEIVTFLAVLAPMSSLFWLLRTITSQETFDSFSKKFELTIEDYKQLLLNIIFNREYDFQYSCARSIHHNYILKNINEEEQIIKDDDLYPFLKKAFVNATKNPYIGHATIRGWLHDCIDYLNGERRGILNPECANAYKKYITKDPTGFIKEFVGLGSYSTNAEFNSIMCQPFMEQIFHTHKKIYKFLKKCKKQKIEGATRAVNFWRLYIANGYNSLPFTNQGNVQSKIDNDLNDETEKFKRLKEISKNVERIYSIYTNTKEVDPESISQLKESLSEIGKIDLRIQYSNDLRVTIDRLINASYQSSTSSK